MNLIKKSYYNFIFAILLFFTMSISCLKAPSICVLAADISASVDYSEYTLKINGIKDGSFTINTYKDKSADAVKKTYTYEVSTDSAEVDLSFLKGKEGYIKVSSGSKETSLIVVKALAGKIKVEMQNDEESVTKFFKVKDAATGAGLPLENVYYRSQYSLSGYKKLTSMTDTKLSQLKDTGAALSFIYMEKGAPASAEIKVTVKARPAGPSLGIDYVNSKIKLPALVNYYVVYTNSKGNKIKSELAENGDSSEKLELEEFLESVNISNPSLVISRGFTVYAYKPATEKKLRSLVTELNVPATGSLKKSGPSVIKEGSVTVFTDSISGATLTCTATDGGYEFTAKGASFKFSKDEKLEKWGNVADGKTVTVKKLSVDEFYVQEKGLNSSKAKSVTGHFGTAVSDSPVKVFRTQTKEK